MKRIVVILAIFGLASHIQAADVVANAEANFRDFELFNVFKKSKEEVAKAAANRPIPQATTLKTQQGWSTLQKSLYPFMAPKTQQSWSTLQRSLFPYPLTAQQIRQSWSPAQKLNYKNIWYAISNKTKLAAAPSQQGWLDYMWALKNSFYKNASELYYKTLLPAGKDYGSFTKETSGKLWNIVQRNPQFTAVAVACVAGVCLAQWYFSSVESQEAFNELEKYKEDPIRSTVKYEEAKKDELRQRLMDASNFSWRAHKFFGFGGYTLYTPSTINWLINGRDIKRIDAFMDAVNKLKTALTAPANEANQRALAEIVKRTAADVQLILIRNAKFALRTPESEK